MTSQIQTHLWGRLFNRPLFVTPERAAELAAYLTHRAGVGGIITGPDIEGVSLGAIQAENVAKYEARRGDGDRYGGSYETIEGVALIPVVGSMVQRLGCMSWSGMVGYDAIKAEILAAIEDDNVAGILLEVDSPGGEVAGCFDLADFIRAARDVKPIWAHANDAACSAAYLLASQASVTTTTQTGRVGSIGVVWVHEDYSGMLDKVGVNVTLVHSGAHKVDGNPYQALPPEVLSTIQGELDELRGMFAAAVNAGRPVLSLDAILGTEARVLNPGDALSIGLVDGVMPLDAAVAAFASQLAGSVPAANIQGKTMSKTKTSPSAMIAGLRAAGVLPKAKAEGDPPEVEKDDPSAIEPTDDTEETPVDDGETEPADDGEGEPVDDGGEAEAPMPPEDEEKPAAAAERKRISAILGAPEASGREGLAAHYAFKTSATVSAARAAMAAAPKAAKGNAFAAAMGGIDNPKVGASAPPADPVLAGFAAATERRYGKVSK